MPRRKQIIVTGIPGSGSTEFCEKYESMDLSAFGVDRVGYHHLGDMLLELAQDTPQRPPIMPENLLNLHPEWLNELQRRSFQNLSNKLRFSSSDDRALIDMHLQFFWNDVFTSAQDWLDLKGLEPSMFITLIEKPSTIRTRQLETPQGLIQNHNLRDLLLWQNLEVNMAQAFAAQFGVPHYVLPGKQDPLTIESLLRSAFLIYFQMPMTSASPEADAKITEFKERLLDIGRRLNGLPTPLIDPRTIDIEDGAGVSPAEERAIRVQTVHRDLNWYIHEASDLVAYYPAGTSISKGVSDESTRGFETGKNTFVIYPSSHTSPFMDIASRVFASEDEFFDFYLAYVEKRTEDLSRNIL